MTGRMISLWKTLIGSEEDWSCASCSGSPTWPHPFQDFELNKFESTLSAVAFTKFTAFQGKWIFFLQEDY